MAAGKARAVAKAEAINREQEFRRLWLMTGLSAVALAMVGIVLVLG